MTEEQSSAVHIQALVSADVILLSISSKLQLLFINLASVPGGQMVNSPTAQSLERCLQFLMTIIITIAILTTIFSLLKHFWKGENKSKNLFSNGQTQKIDNKIILSVEEFVEKYQTNKGKVKGGTLCFWGHWFGRPYDNLHTIVSVDFDKHTNNLKIRFSEGETLAITNAVEIHELIGNEPYTNRIEIPKAERIHWEWNSYGELATSENLLYYEFTKKGERIEGTTNSKRYPNDFKDLDILKPAVLLT